MFKIIKHLYIIIITIVIINCPTKKDVKGEVYIKLIDFGSMYGQPTADINEFKNKFEKEKDLSDKAEIKYFQILIENGLIDKPYFKLKLLNNRDIVNVFCSEAEYLNIKPLLDNLNKSKEKIIVEFNGIKKGDNIYYASKLISFEKVQGKTEWKK